MKIKIWGYLLLGGIYLFAACKISKDVKRPELILPGSFRTAAEPANSESIAKLPLNAFIKDPSLKELLDSAIIRNNDLQIALKNIDIARQVLLRSKWGNVPALSLGISASSSRPSDNSLNGISLSQFLGQKHIEDYTSAANISWEADIWGKIKSQKQASLAGYLQSEEAKKAVRTELVSDVAKGYYNLLMLDEQLTVATKNVALSDSTLKIVELQYKAGLASFLAVQQAEAQRLNAAKLVPLFEQEILIQENNLSILCGRSPDAITRLKKLEDLEVPSSLSAGVPAALLGARPDIRRAELDLDRANAEVGYAKAQMYPRLTITASGGVNAFKASNWFNIPSSLFGAVAGGITQPLFQRRETKTNYEIAKAERDKSVIRFRQQVLIAVGEVSDALVRIEKLDLQQKLSRDRVSTLRSATGNADQLFRNGMANYLEVITAQSNVLQGELELASIRKAQLDATIDLYRSAGGGWR